MHKARYSKTPLGVKFRPEEFHIKIYFYSACFKFDNMSYKGSKINNYKPSRDLLIKNNLAQT